MAEAIIVRPQKPEGPIMERLLRLQERFTPQNVHVTLSPTKKITYADFPDVVTEYVESLERLEAWIQNGHSTVGLWFDGEWKEIFND